MAVGADGNLWVPELYANVIARVTVGGAVTEFPLPTAGAGPYLITPGPDGNLWFTEFNVNTIGRITTGGVVTEFPLPASLATAPSSLQGITAGPDGNLWFVHGGANVIGVISTSGTLLATYPIPTANPPEGQTGAGEAIWIVTGPDKNLWFTEDTGNRIGRITTSGVITEFPIPTANCWPRSLLVGADGNLWFAELNAGQIARITTSGVITEFPMVADPTVHRLRRIAMTSDGRMWVVSAMVASPWDSEIGTFNTAGVETDLWSVGGDPRAIIGGRDGNPWFADQATESVVRL
jgi:virginiamycin B lyase